MWCMDSGNAHARVIEALGGHYPHNRKYIPDRTPPQILSDFILGKPVARPNHADEAELNKTMKSLEKLSTRLQVPVTRFSGSSGETLLEQVIKANQDHPSEPFDLSRPPPYTFGPTHIGEPVKLDLPNQFTPIAKILSDELMTVAKSLSIRIDEFQVSNETDSERVGGKVIAGKIYIECAAHSPDRCQTVFDLINRYVYEKAKAITTMPDLSRVRFNLDIEISGAVDLAR